MMTLMRYPVILLLTLVVPVTVLAQGIRNSDISFMFGPVRTPAYVVAGTTISVASSTGIAEHIGYGYQF